MKHHSLDRELPIIDILFVDPRSPLPHERERKGKILVCEVSFLIGEGRSLCRLFKTAGVEPLCGLLVKNVCYSTGSVGLLLLTM